MFRAGQVIWGPDPHRKKEGRPLIVAVDEDASGALVVCTTTSKSIYTDTTTCLEGGCHPDLPHDCTVDYDSARYIPNCNVLRDSIRAGILRTDPLVFLDSADLARVQAGFAKSDLVNEDAKRYAKKRRII